MSYKLVRSHEDKRGKVVTVVYDVPGEDVMSRSASELIAASTSACHVSQCEGVEELPHRRDIEDDYVVEVV